MPEVDAAHRTLRRRSARRLLGAIVGALWLVSVARAGGDDDPGAYLASALLPIDPQVQGLVRVPLGLALLSQLRSQRRDDLRVFNAAGESVAFAWAGAPTAAPGAAAKVGLPKFRWPEAPAASASQADADVRIELAGDGRVLRVERRGVASPRGTETGAAPVRWLLDLAPVGEQRPTALHLDLPPTPAEGVVAAAQVEASADARRWRSVGEATVLWVRDAASGLIVDQRRIPLDPLERSERYLRLKLSPGLAVERVEAELPPAQAPTPLASERFRLQRDGDRHWTLDTGAVLPVQRLQVHVGQDNAVLPLAVSHRLRAQTPAGRVADRSDPWSFAFAYTAYRLRRDGTVVASPPIDVDAGPAREWRFVLDERVSPPDAALEATLWWPEPQLIVAARGPAPFRLALGREGARAAAVDRAVLIPGYRDGDEFALPLVAAGPVEVRPATPPTWRERLAAAGPEARRRWLLWLVLGLAVVVLAVLAWRLARDLGAARPPPT